MTTAYVLLEDGARFDGEAVAAPGPVTGEVVFTTAMSGYQESMTDPSYAGQIITFTYPHVGNYGVSGEAMESDRVHARAAIMRAAVNREDAPGAERGWLDWLEDCGVPAITGVDTRALVRHIRDRGAMRGGIFPAEVPEAEAWRAFGPSRRWRAATSPAACRRTASVEVGDGDGPRIAALDTGIKRSIVRNLVARGARVELHPCTATAGRAAGPRPRRVLPRQRARRPGGARLRRRHGPRAASGSGRCSASASATSCCAARSAWRRSSSRSATAAPTTRSRTSRPAGSRSRRRTTASRSSAPDGGQRIEADEPVRWETDFGAAELTHVNLYDRTVEGLRCSTCPAARSSTTPRPGPARTTRCTCSTGSSEQIAAA